jgi:hypothetical protein
MKKIILSILILSSIVFLALALKNFNTPEPPAPTLDVIYSKVIEKDKLQRLEEILDTKLNRQNASVSAVFFMYSKNCNACFNEVNEYINILTERSKNLQKEIALFGIFHHTNANISKRFEQTTDLKFDNVISLNGNFLVEEDYLTFNGEIGYNQLVFFKKNGDLVSRILLPTGIITPKKKKEEVLNIILNQKKLK